MRQPPLRMAVGLLVFLAGANLSAQAIKPGFVLAPAWDTPRAHAPIQLNAHLSWSSIDLLAGRLQLEFYVNQRLVHTWVSREVVLSASELTLAVMVPPALLASDSDRLSARATFLGEQNNYDLDIHDVPYPVDFKRTLTIGIVHPETAGMPPSDFTTPFQDRFAWVQPFRLDAALPNKDWARHLTCRSMPIEPELFPDDPLEIVAFDLLLVTSDGLSDLNDDQLDSLARWVEAGGALCVAGEQARTEEHRTFLKRISGSSPIEPILEFDDDGIVRPLFSNESPWLLANPGVGRALVTFEPVDVDTPAWRRAVLELWRVRPQQINIILANGDWEFEVEYDHLLLDPAFQPLRPDTQSDVAAVQAQLMPERVEGVPLPTVAILLAACLLAVGPGDYLLLGWLKRRRWTWVLFPVIAISFSIFTVRLAQSHMGHTDHRTTLSVVDLTQDGRPARISRFELLFAASEKQIEEALSQTMAVPLDSRQKSFDQGFGPGYGQFRQPPAPAGPPPAPPAVTVGRMPRSYKHVRSLRQWTPRLARYTVMGSDDDTVVPDFRLTLLNSETLRDAEHRDEFLNRLKSRFPEAHILLLHRNESWQLDPVDAGADSDDSVSEAPSVSELPVEFAIGISARAPAGFFHIVSQISPDAAGNFEDLTVFDRDDSRQWLLLILTTDDEGNTYIYRRLFREDT